MAINPRGFSFPAPKPINCCGGRDRANPIAWPTTITMRVCDPLSPSLKGGQGEGIQQFICWKWFANNTPFPKNKQLRLQICISLRFLSMFSCKFGTHTNSSLTKTFRKQKQVFFVKIFFLFPLQPMFVESFPSYFPGPTWGGAGLRRVSSPFLLFLGHNFDPKPIVGGMVPPRPIFYTSSVVPYRCRHHP